MSDHDGHTINVGPVTPLQADCISGGYAYVGHGIRCVMVAFTPEVKWWRNSTWLEPEQARALANALLRQADAAEAASDTDEGQAGSFANHRIESDQAYSPLPTVEGHTTWATSNLSVPDEQIERAR